MIQTISSAGRGGRFRSVIRPCGLFLMYLIQLTAAAMPSRTTAAGLPVSAADLIEVADISGVTVSPNKELVVFRVEMPDVAANREHLKWFVARLDGTEPAHEIADAGDPIWDSAGQASNEEPTWASDSKSFYFRALHGEEVQLWRASIVHPSVEQLTNDAADIDSYGVDVTRNALFYVVRATRDEIKEAEKSQYVNGVVLDSTVQMHTAVLNNFPYHGRMATLRYTTSDRSILLNDRPERVKVLDLAAKTAHDAGSQELVAYQRLMPPPAMPASAGRVAIEQEPHGNRIAFFEKTAGSKWYTGPVSQYFLKWAASQETSASTHCPDPACTNTKGGDCDGARMEGRYSSFPSSPLGYLLFTDGIYTRT